jgi:hypothetical protein
VRLFDWGDVAGRDASKMVSASGSQGDAIGETSPPDDTRNDI